MVSVDCSRKLLYFCNLVLWFGGAALLGFGIWMKLDPTILHYLELSNIHNSDPFLHYAAWIFIGAGALALMVGIIGCCGACKDNQGALFLYIILILLVMAGEIVGGVLALTYRGKVSANLLDSMQHQIQMESAPGSPTMDSWNWLQQEHKCCGAANFTDWSESAWHNATKNHVVPASCCEGTNTTWVTCDREATDGQAGSVLYGTGCHDAVLSWFQRHSLIMTILGIAIGAAQIFGFLAACCLRSAMRDTQYK